MERNYAMTETTLTNHVPSLRGWRAEVGVLTPMTWMCREWEVAAPEGVKFSKAAMGHEEHTAQALKDLADAVEAESKKLNHGRKCDLIVFACTSGGFIEGPQHAQKLINKIERASGSPATTTISCVLELFEDMGVKKISLVGPYPDFTFEEEVKLFDAYGIETLHWQGMGLVPMAEYWEFGMNPYSCYKIVKEGAKAAPEADCVFLTCMVSPMLGVADTLEREIGKPVISSQSATLYGILKKLGIPDPVYNYGEALRRPRC